MAAPQAKVPHALDEHEIDQPERGRDIVRKGPRLHQPTEAKDKAGSERETHATVTDDPGKRNQGQQTRRTNIKTPELQNLVRCPAQEPTECVSLVELADFPPRIVVPHHRVMILWDG